MTYPNQHCRKYLISCCSVWVEFECNATYTIISSAHACVQKFPTNHCLCTCISIPVHVCVRVCVCAFPYVFIVCAYGVVCEGDREGIFVRQNIFFNQHQQSAQYFV